MAEELDLHLFEFATTERVIARIDLVAKCLPDLGDSKWKLESRAVKDVAVVDEDSLRSFRAQERSVLLVANGPDVGLEHQIELARLR